MVYTVDLKSADHYDHAGSSPVPGTSLSYKGSGLNMVIRRRYVPISEVPFMWYVRSAHSVVNKFNGFKLHRIATNPPTYFITRGDHIWKETTL